MLMEGLLPEGIVSLAVVGRALRPMVVPCYNDGVAVDVLGDLVARWRSSGLSGGPPLADRAVEAFERRFRLRLPPEFRRYLLSVNGMADGEMDAALIHFWTLDEMAAHLNEPGLAERFLFIPFADYSIHIWV